MAIGTANISMDDIAAELQYGTSLPNNSMVNYLYDSSQLAYDIHGGSYHNIGMGIGGTGNFQQSIEYPYSVGQNMKLRNWALYDHDTTAKVDLIINNGSRFDVDFRIYINDTPAAGSVVVFNAVVPASNVANILLLDFDTTAPAFANFYGGGGYWIVGEINAVSPGGTPVLMGVASADVDNVGAGITRFDYTNDGTPGGLWDLNPNTGGNPFNDVLISGDNGNPFPNDAISWNKRTIIAIDII